MVLLTPYLRKRGVVAALLAAACLLSAGTTALAQTSEHNAAAKEQMATKQMAAKQMATKNAMMAAKPAKPMMSGSNIRNHRACNPDGIALAGIDVVSYHKATGPLFGSAEFSVEHGGLSYHFLSAAHASEFTADPERFLPKYLGWCATSLAVGALTCPNPLNYKVENGELLLFETTGFTNGQSLWNADPLDYRRRANLNRDAFLQTSGR